MNPNLAALIGQTQARFPPPARTARNLLALVSATHEAADRTREEIGVLEAPPGLRIGTLAELAELDDRLDAYARHLASLRPRDPMPPQLAPLLFEADRRTPDFATPFAVEGLDLDDLASSLDAFSKTLEDRASSSISNVARRSSGAVEDVAERSGEAAAKGAARAVWPWVVGAAAIAVVAGGALIYAAR